MGDFAANVAIAHQIGSARGGLSVLSAMDIRDDEFFAAFGRSINELVMGHRRHLEVNRGSSNSPSKVNQRWLEATSMAAGPKTRWVDGTPEYSFHICGLRKLFPEAVFIHLVRDADSVVRSMLNFHRVEGTRLVASEQKAYEYWLRAVNACLMAEQAYGPDVIYRLLYSQLVKQPELAFRSLLNFIGEPYNDKCLAPLAERINSSNVPSDFESNEADTDPAIVEEARRLSAEIETTMQPSNVSTARAAELETTFREASVESSVRVARVEQKLLEQKRQYEGQIISQERHYIAEVEQYKTQIARQELHYTAEVDQYKMQIASQERHYTNEVEQYKVLISAQQRDHSAALQGYRSQTRILKQMLNQVEKAAARLRKSRRWKFVNLVAVIKAKLSHKKQLPGYGDLDKVVAAYSAWRASYAESTNTSRPAKATTQTDSSATTGERLADSESAGKPAMTDRLAKPAENRYGV